MTRRDAMGYQDRMSHQRQTATDRRPQRRASWAWPLLAATLAFHALAQVASPIPWGASTPGVFVRCGWIACRAQPATRAAARELGASEAVVTHVNGIRLPLGHEGELAALRALDASPGAINRLMRAPEDADGSNASELVVSVRADPAEIGALWSLRDVTRQIVLICVLFLGVLVWRRRPSDPAAPPLLAFACVLAVGFAWVSPEAVGTSRALSELGRLVVAAYGPVLLRLGLSFPGSGRPRWARRAEKWVDALSVVALVALLAIRVAIWNASPYEAHAVAIALPVFGLQFVSVLVLCLLHCYRTFRTEGPPLPRERARIFALGFGVAMVPPTVRLVAQPWLDPAALELAGVVESLAAAALPAILAYAIAARRLFDLRLFLRDGAVYTVLTLLVTLAYVVVVLSAASLWGTSFALTGSSALLVGSLILLASLLKVRVQHVVDRWVHRQGAVYSRAVLEASEVLSRTRSVDAVADIVRRTFVDAMRLERAALATQQSGSDHARVVTAAAAPWPAAPEPPQPLPERLDLRRAGELLRTSELGELAWISGAVDSPLEGGSQPDAASSESVLFAWGVVVVVPLRVDPSSESMQRAWLLLGPKQSGAPLSSEDRDLIATVANQLAIALDNALAFAAIEQLKEGLERTVEVRTRELREAQEKLVERERRQAVDRLVAGLVHELNSPLGALRSAAQCMPRGLEQIEAALDGSPGVKRPVEATRSLSAIMITGVERVSQLVTSLKAFVALDEAETQTVDVRESLEAALVLLRHRLTDRVSVACHFGERRALVHCDAGGLNHVLLNLIDNALGAIPGGGKLELRCEVDSSGVQILIADDGCGISPERLPGVFEPRLGAKGSRVGLGLGLPQAKRFVEGVGGHIEVESEVGRGTRVRVSLPSTTAMALTRPC